jgi:hypothetical protein
MTGAKASRTEFAGRETRLPPDPALRPDPELLAWHRVERFIA